MLYILITGENSMKKSVSLIALALVSIISLIYPVFTAFASQPTVIIDPPQGDLESSFNFVITATSWSTVKEVKVEDPEGKYWVLKGLTSAGWRNVKITLRDAGDQVKLTWSDASISVLNDPDGDVRVTSSMGWPMTDFKWVNGDGVSPHTQLMGAYGLSFSGRGCHYFFVNSFFVVPEGPLGTIGAVLAMFSVFALRNRKNYSRG